ncbi:hypothetical protein SAMN03080615_04361 [Amphritea atlantica]|uniref:Uncharacterized protein n=1 Tax=Amphritea atlantica TaxID=355243 RepID=A0A1H9MC06_9GAMM|nr:hypothetical protein [Amphritea atlantica]SER20967.1 hypothetical protein SAMN03080615_04361 [Amphritea atlantica]
MIGKFFLAFGLFLLYMVLLGAVGIAIVEGGGSKGALVSFLLAGIVGMVPVMMLIGRKVMASKADPSVEPVTPYELIERLRALKVQGSSFELLEKDDLIIIAPPLLTTELTLGMQHATVEQTFFVKIWLDEKQHHVSLKDVVTTRTERRGAGEYYFQIRGQSGFVTCSTLVLDDGGNVVKLGNGTLHNALIKLFNESGWDVSFKII